MAPRGYSVAAVALSVLLFCDETQGEPVVPTAETALLVEANPGLRTALQGDALIGLHGVPFSEDSNVATSTGDFVANFIGAQADALGVEPDMLVLRNEVTIRNGKFRVYTYEQRIGGVPVHGTVLKIPVRLGTTEKISYVGMRLVQPPTAPFPPDLVSANQAVTIVSAIPEYSHLPVFGAPEMVIFDDLDGLLHRAWRFAGSGDLEGYLFFVDTNTGELLSAPSTVYSSTIAGTVSGYSTPCCAPDDPSDPATCPQSVPLRDLKVNGSIGGVTYTTHTDADGLYVLDNLPASGQVSVEADLSGQWVTVHSELPPDLVLSTSANPGSSGNDLVFNPASCVPRPPDGNTAQVNAYVGVQKAHDWFKERFGVGQASPIDMNVLCNVNVEDPNFVECNAFYSAPSTLFFLPAGPTCQNAAFSTIVAHEYGHFIVNRIVEDGITGRAHGAFHEGAADAVAALS